MCLTFLQFLHWELLGNHKIYLRLAPATRRFLKIDKMNVSVALLLATSPKRICPEHMKYAQFRGWVRHFIRFSKWLPIFQ